MKDILKFKNIDLDGTALITSKVSLLDYKNIMPLDMFLSKTPDTSEVVVAHLRLDDDFSMSVDRNFSVRCGNGRSGHSIYFNTNK